MNINTAFPSNYLKADDLGKSRPVVTISDVRVEKVGEDEKPIVFFEGKEKGLVLNKTNAATIAELADSPETDDWNGVRVRLYATKVDFQGRRVLAIRIEEAPPAPRAATRQPEPEPEPDFVEVGDDEIPFAWLLPFILPMAAAGMAFV